MTPPPSTRVRSHVHTLDMVPSPTVPQEYARCRRLNVTLSSALGSRACDTLEADFCSSYVADRPVAGRGSSGGGSVGGGWLPLPPAAPQPRTSGLFRRLPPGPPPTPNSASAAASAVRATPGLLSDSRSPLLPPPLPPPPPPPLMRSADDAAAEASARGGAAGGRAAIDSAERPWLAASEVRRAMRFCMKVHRYREICRPRSCVAFRKVSTAAETPLGCLLPIHSASLPGLAVMLRPGVIPGPNELDVWSRRRLYDTR